MSVAMPLAFNALIQSIRASSCPQAFRCPASIRAGDGSIILNETHEMARAGSAAHELERMLPEQGRIDFDAIPEIALKWEVDAEELRILAAAATKLWREVKQFFHGAVAEVALESEILDGVLLTGHADLIKKDGRVGRGADFKNGRKDSDYSQQMKAYCVLILLDDPELQEVTFTLLWVRSGEVENYTMTRAGMREWVRELVEQVIHWDGVFRPGLHCEYCPRAHECPAQNALMRKHVATFADLGLDSELADLRTMSGKRKLELVETARTVEHMAKKVRELIKADVIANGDAVGDGKVLTLESSPKRQASLAATFPILTAEGFGDEDFEDCASLSLSKAEKIVAERAGKGNGARAVRDLRAKLEAANAVTTKEELRLVVRRA